MTCFRSDQDPRGNGGATLPARAYTYRISPLGLPPPHIGTALILSPSLPVALASFLPAGTCESQPSITPHRRGIKALPLGGIRTDATAAPATKPLIGITLELLQGLDDLADRARFGVPRPLGGGH